MENGWEIPSSMPNFIDINHIIIFSRGWVGWSGAVFNATEKHVITQCADILYPRRTLTSKPPEQSIITAQKDNTNKDELYHEMLSTQVAQYSYLLNTDKLVIMVAHSASNFVASAIQTKLSKVHQRLLGRLTYTGQVGTVYLSPRLRCKIQPYSTHKCRIKPGGGPEA
ncbi:hypothetical protein CHS0354_042007, partial [Potamilus streckersoni]